MATTAITNHRHTLSCPSISASYIHSSHVVHSVVTWYTAQSRSPAIRDICHVDQLESTEYERHTWLRMLTLFTLFLIQTFIVLNH